MSLHSFLHRGDAPTAPKRITIRRRLLGRGSRLRSMSMAAGLLSLGLASFQPAHAGTITWDGVPADWFTAPSHWSNGATPLATDDAQNLTAAAMTLGQSTTVNSFLSNGAFTFNGGTFTGNQANAASTLQVNNIFTLNGGQINNFTLQAGVKQASGPVPSVVVTNSGGNGLLNTIVNANLDLATNANAFLRIQGTNTVNGTISFGTTSNGLNIYTTNDNLIIGGSGKLIGFGNVFESGSGSILTNNGLINANVSGKALTQTNSNFVNSGTAEATNGATLALNNTLTNSGKLIADGVGSTLTLAGTLASNAGNTISATNGGQVLVNGVALSGTLNGVGATSLIFNNSGNNGLTNTTANINLDLATNANAFLRIQGTNTVNGTISFGTTSNGLNIYTTGDNLIIGGGSKLIGFGNVFESGSGSILTNNGTINATGGALTQTNSNFVNNGTAKATNGATLALNNNIANSAGATVAATGAGSLVTLTGTFTGTGNNLITASGGGQVQVNGVALRGIINTDAGTSLILNNSGSNNLTNTVVNGNLSLTNNSFLRVQGTDTVNGTISLSTTSNGLDIYTTNDNLILGGSGKLVGFGTVFESGSGSILTNNGLVNANVSGKTLNIANSNFNNAGTTQVTNGATLSVTSNSTNSGVVNVQGGGTANFSGLTQTAGLTQVDGVLNLVNNSALTLSGTKSGGTLLGSGQIVGNVVNTNGIVSPGDSPGTLGITGNYTQGSAGTLDIEFTNSLHDLLNVSGLATTGGLLDVNYIDTSAFTGAVGSQFAFLDYGTLAAGSGPNFGFTVTGHNGFTYTVVNDAANKMLDLQIGAIGSPVPAVPEASTTLSFGLLLLLGLGGTVVATKRKKSD